MNIRSLTTTEEKTEKKERREKKKREPKVINSRAALFGEAPAATSGVSGRRDVSFVLFKHMFKWLPELKTDFTPFVGS